MSHSQIQAPKHYREQVIQALKKKISTDLAMQPTQTYPSSTRSF